MYTERLCGTICPYKRHVFLCFEDWSDRVERLAGAIMDVNKAISVQTRLTICKGGDGTGLSNGDALIFPDMIKYRGLEESNINRFVEEVLVNGKAWALGTQEVVTGSYVFVCAHGKARDKRCRVCGPALIKKFNEELELRALKDKVFVSAFLGVLNHVYAGHLVIYSAAEDGKVSGHWYGYVIPDDVAELVDQHIKKGEIIERIWMGQMGVPLVEKAEKAAEQTHPNGNDLKVGEKDDKISNKKKNASSGAKKSSCNAAAVVGAVATVAVAFSLFKRSR